MIIGFMVGIGLPMTIWYTGFALVTGELPMIGKILSGVADPSDTAGVFGYGLLWVGIPVVCGLIGAAIGLALNLAFRAFVGFCNFISATFGGEKKSASGAR